MCIEFADGTAVMPALENQRCGWPQATVPGNSWPGFDGTRWSRAEMATQFLNKAAPKGLHGVVLVETHDRKSSRSDPKLCGASVDRCPDHPSGVTVPRNYVEQLAALNIPVMAFSARATRTDIVLIPDPYFLKTHGYHRVRHTWEKESLNDLVDRVSTSVPWSEKVRSFRSSNVAAED